MHDQQADDYSQILRELLTDGWTVQSEGPSGAQLVGHKRARLQTKVAIVVGAVLLLAWGIGLIVLIFAFVDYSMTKPQTHFLDHSAPEMPGAPISPPMSPIVKWALILIVGLIVLGAVGSMLMRG